MIRLHAKHLDYFGWAGEDPRILKVTENTAFPDPLKRGLALIVDDTTEFREGYAAVLVRGLKKVEPGDRLKNVVMLGEGLNHISEGDVVRLNPANGDLRVLYRKESQHNSLLLTERCNSFCLMCSQPPREIDDSYLIADTKLAIELMDRETQELGLTGGEPTLLGDGFLEIVRHARNFLPNTALHVLTNGRRFKDKRFVRKLAELGHPDIMLGVPLYSEQPDVHDFVVQAKGAFDETVKGLLNLAEARLPIEIRVVVHKQTYKGLAELARYICRNLPFAHHVAFMGLEPTGFAKANFDALWIDPYSYKSKLDEAVQILHYHGVSPAVFNHQLCVLEPSTRPFSVRSISDWKRTYIEECDRCAEREHCGGLFETGYGTRAASKHIRAL